MFTFTLLYPNGVEGDVDKKKHQDGNDVDEDDDDYDPMMDDNSSARPITIGQEIPQKFYRTQAKLFTFDSGVKILADPGWDGRSDLSFLDELVPKIDLILLSQTTAEYLGAFAMLLFKYPLLRKVKTYSTLPIAKIGRLSVVELYRSCGLVGPLEDSVMEVEDIENYFNQITTLNFAQSVSLQGNFSGITLTAYNSGHTLGGSFWLFTKEGEKTLYVPSWNHSKDSFLKAAKLVSSNLTRPTTLITGSDLGSNMSHKKRVDKFVDLINLTLTNNSSVILPTSIGGRIFELLPIISSRINSTIPIVLVSFNGDSSLKFSSNMLEWMSPDVTKAWESQNHSPFDSNRLRLCSLDDLSDIDGPKVVFCTGIDFEEGSLSREVMATLCARESCAILMTERPGFESTGHEFYSYWENASKQNDNFEDGSLVVLEKHMHLSLVKEESLHGHELSTYMKFAEDRRENRLKTELLEKANEDMLMNDEIEDDQENEDRFSGDEDERTDTNKANGTTTTSTVAATASIRHNSSISSKKLEDEESVSIQEILKMPMDFDVRGAKGRNRLFPFIQKATTFDDYGQVIRHVDFMREEEKFPLKKSQFGRDNDFGKIKNERENGDEIEEEEEVEEEIIGGKRRRRPGNRASKSRKLGNENLKKVAARNPLLELGPFENPRSRETSAVNIDIRCGLSYIDLAGLVDLRSLRLTINALKPRKVIVLPETSIGYGGGSKDIMHALTASHQQERNELLLRGDSYRSWSTDYLLAQGNESIDLGDVITSYQVQLSDALSSSLHWQSISGGYSVAYIAGQISDGSEEENKENNSGVVEVLDDDQSTDKSKTLVVKSTSKVLTLKPVDSSKSLSTNDTLAIGDIKLTELRKKLMAMNHTAEFKGDGTLVVDNYLSVRKITDGNLIIDGNISKLFYEVREVIQNMVANI